MSLAVCHVYVYTCVCIYTSTCSWLVITPMPTQFQKRRRGTTPSVETEGALSLWFVFMFKSLCTNVGAGECVCVGSFIRCVFIWVSVGLSHSSFPYPSMEFMAIWFGIRCCCCRCLSSTKVWLVTINVFTATILGGRVEFVPCLFVDLHHCRRRRQHHGVRFRKFQWKSISHL